MSMSSMPRHIFTKPADRRRIRRRAALVYRDDTPRIAMTIVTVALLLYTATLLLASVAA
ncbi:MAG: hypothetical protein LLF96_04400 [Eubacteriales bacterium]|nr:hypothetical protein [Eubacteriales bacterium]